MASRGSKVVTAGESQVSRRAATRVIALLGINLWVTIVVVPSVYLVRAAPIRLSLALVPLVVLAVSALRLSPLGLLFLYPASVIAFPALDHALIGVNMRTTMGFVVTALSLSGYLFGACYLMRRRVVVSVAQSERRLPTPESAEWQRRRQIHRFTLALAAPFVPVLLYAVNLKPATQEALRRFYGGKTAPVAALMNVLVLALWLGLFVVYFAGALKADHRGDPELTRNLHILRREVVIGRPRAAFFLGVILALALMAILIWMRKRT